MVGGFLLDAAVAAHTCRVVAGLLPRVAAHTTNAPVTAGGRGGEAEASVGRG